MPQAAEHTRVMGRVIGGATPGESHQGGVTPGSYTWLGKHTWKSHAWGTTPRRVTFERNIPGESHLG